MNRVRQNSRFRKGPILAHREKRVVGAVVRQRSRVPARAPACAPACARDSTLPRSNSVCRAHIAREFGFSRASFASRAPEIIHSRPNAFQNAPKRHQNVPERPQNAPERPPEDPRTTPERPRTLENDHRVLHNDARMTASGNIWECLRSSGASRSCVSACDLPSLRPGK